jgi:hypothetical protein
MFYLRGPEKPEVSELIIPGVSGVTHGHNLKGLIDQFENLAIWNLEQYMSHVITGSPITEKPLMVHKC